MVTMIPGRNSAPARCAGGLASVSFGILVRLLLDPWLGAMHPFLIVLAAVVFTARFGGTGLTLAALVAGTLGVVFFILPPRHSFRVESPEHLVGLVLFVAVGLGSMMLF